MLKSFDFFRKIQTEQQLTSTTGGCFTILAFLTAAFLIFLSIQDYYHETFFTFLAVKNDDSQYLPMRIDITFNKMPCQAIQIEFNDQLQYSEPDLQDKLKMYSINFNKEQTLYVRDKNNYGKEKADLQHGLKEKYQCRINGILNIPKTPGTLTFRAVGNGNIISTIDRSIWQSSRLSYILKTLQFGLGNNTFDFPIAHISYIVESYIKQLEGIRAFKQFVQDFTHITENVNFYNHLKIIPVVFDEQSNLTEKGQKYRYSLRAGQANAYEPFQQLIFYTQIEPINIVYKKQPASLYNLFVNILAIVGGTVATIGVVNSLSHFLFNIK